MNDRGYAIPMRIRLILLYLGVSFSWGVFAEPGEAPASAPLLAEWATWDVPPQCWDIAVDSGGNAVLAGDDLNRGRGILKKYGDSGAAAWTMEADVDASYWRFYSVAVDAKGNVFGSGSVGGKGFDLGNGVKLGPLPERQSGMILMKSDSGGKAAWAQASFNQIPEQYAPGDRFAGLAVDAAGNVFALGKKHQRGSNYPFLGKSSKIADIDRYNGDFIVKVDASGRAMGVATVDMENVVIEAVATDGSNLYAAGFVYLYGSDSVDFGNGVRLPAPTGVHCAILVKYDPSLKALWARIVTGGVRSPSGNDGDCYFSSLAVDGRGNAYAGGYVSGTRTLDLGNGVTAAGTDPKENPLLAKYDASGKALWARSVDYAPQGDRALNVRIGSMGVYAWTRSGSAIFGFDFAGKRLWRQDLPPGNRISLVAVGARDSVYATASGESTGLPADAKDAGERNYLIKYRNAAFESRAWATASNPNVRVRSGANLQASTLGYLDKGDVVEILERGPERMKIEAMEDYWYRIRRASDGLEGWSYGAYLKITEKK